MDIQVEFQKGLLFFWLEAWRVEEPFFEWWDSNQGYSPELPVIENIHTLNKISTIFSFPNPVILQVCLLFNFKLCSLCRFISSLSLHSRSRSTPSFMKTRL
ncbi:predicted protein [Methanosarcina acetivorans C2A]|uniref:Uncharacterized protein n=1 Tax=Methanosarcina acetivorans (strain ATCC 35395 / DSM 2834 / JCM 12185 / C2A) TaxID=188937 RepID=Q8TK59_METAC|nr:predicted protein [Methanosarcina acetivorans C2A]